MNNFLYGFEILEGFSGGEGWGFQKDGTLGMAFQVTLHLSLGDRGSYGSHVVQGPSAPKPADDETADVDDTKFDSFMGNDTGAFAFGEYDKDDKEADEVCSLAT